MVASSGVEANTTGVDLEKAHEFAEFVAKTSGALGLETADQSELEAAAEELESAIADPAAVDHGRVRALLNRMAAKIGKSAPSIVTKVSIGLAVAAAKQELPALEQFAHHL